MTLAPKRAAFAREWLVDFNATQAALRAGYAKPSAGSQGSDLLKDPKVQAEIARLQQAVAVQVDASPENVIAEIARVAFARYGTYAKLEGGELTITDMADLPDGADAAIAEMTQRTTAGGVTTIKLKLHNKLDALDKLGRVLGLFVDRLHITGSLERPLRSFTVDELTTMLELADADEAPPDAMLALEGEATVVEDEDTHAREDESRDA